MTDGKEGRLQATPDEVARLMRHVRQEKNGCWAWTGGGVASGYGYVSFRGKHGTAHRLFYKVFVGPIPKGFVIHHRCRNRRCVNPAHLELLTTAENVRRTILRGRQNYNGAKTHCKHGHPFSGANLAVVALPDGRTRRVCKACLADAQRKRRDKLKRTRLEEAAAGSTVHASA